MVPSNFVDYYHQLLEDRLGKEWLGETSRKDDPVRRMWRAQAHNPFQRLRICQIGRDIDYLREIGDDRQQERLAALLQKVKDGPAQALDTLYELHVAMLFRPEHGGQGTLAPRDEQGYDVVVEVMGDVANPMGGSWRLLGGRKLWVSCKRVNPSMASGEFAGRAQTVCEELRVAASAAGHRMYAGVAISRDELPAHSTTLRELWDTLCRTHAPLSGTKALTHGPYTVLLGPHPAVQPANLASLRPGHALQVFGALPKQEYKRIEGVMQKAVDDLKAARDANVIPAPSRADAWVLAIEIPRWVSAAAVAHLAAKQFAAGKFHDLSAVLLTRSLNALSLSPPPTAVLTQEVYLVENVWGTIPLKAFLGDTPLQPRVSGEYLEAPAVLVVPNSQPPFTSPDGYVYQEYGYQGAQSWPTPPDVLLPQLRVPRGHEAVPTLPVLDRLPAPRDTMPASGHPADLPLVPATVGQ